MVGNASGPIRANGSTPEICSALTLCDLRTSAALGRRPAVARASSILSIDGSALRAVLAARTLRAAHAAAHDGLATLAQGDPGDLLRVDEAAALSGRTPSTIRRWAAAHRLGRRLGGRWLLSRARFSAFVEGGAA